MKRKLILNIFYMIILIFPGILCKERKVLEKEPNDSFDTANFIEVNGRIEGFINSAADKDYFKFIIKKESILDINLSGLKGVNIAFQIWRMENKPRLLKYIDDNRKSSQERMNNLYAEPGTYCIAVIHGARDPKTFNLETPYSLSISSRDATMEEHEPNDRSEEATQINEKVEYSGYFSPSYNFLNSETDNHNREEDWYSFKIDRDSELPVLVNIILSGVPGINSELFLFDSGGEMLISSNSNETGFGEEIRGAGITKPGLYCIMVCSKGNSSNSEQPYKIRYEFDKFSPDHEMEPNNDFSKANAITGDIMKGRIDRPGDRDFFLYKPAHKNPGYYRISIQSPPEIDIKASIYDMKKNIIHTMDNTGKGETEVMPNLTIDSDFYITVQGKLEQFDRENDYNITITHFEDEEFMETEPNNTKNLANHVKGDYIRGFISSARDVDYFLLEYDRRERILFAIEGIKDGEIKVSIADSLGYIIKSITLRGNSRKNLTEMIDRKGYVIVESLRDNFSNPYRIGLRRIN